ncbi:ParA family protein [Mesorhizobium dulcispinae]|uniref:ParA family protein n=1 Tax=Mesorhizobium dulcispinae TaxID=3072316 RepID=UPI002A23F0AF|nr:ParA family protein [Mesorhizobium sp. VK23D]MDX8521105.1 ParA family protein [Mesorhizobium sp. VK23D]
MFTITFYSYKGGVGRTMALINTAAELTRRGRRVLIMDFDLEAPGISTYKPFQNSGDSAGLVDYVAEFSKTLRAPNASEFVFECILSIDGTDRPIWVFPAGRRDEMYGAKLASIDWQDLYEHRDGYLLFEDLRQQLKNDYRHFDYILIDSRTGYTDVGGICTRQLADVAVLMFFPNEQNIHGLEAIANEIRIASANRSRQLDLLFVPSNVPDLDDEDGILKHMMALAGERLSYDEASSVIHHYDSMSLLDQNIFVLSRPRSRLAEEYRALTKAIVQLNIEDRDGALFALQKLRTRLEQSGSRGSNERHVEQAGETSIINSLDDIGRIHSSDGEVAWNLATVYRSLGNFSNELNALNDAIQAGYSTASVRLRRALNLMSQSRPTEAKSDLLAALSSHTAGPIELRSAIEAMRSIDPQWHVPTETSKALANLEPSDLMRLAEVMMMETNDLKIMLPLFEKAIAKPSAELVRSHIRNHMALTLIGLGKFDEAVNFIAEDRQSIFSTNDVPSIFNLAMAEWGRDQYPSYDILGHFVSFFDRNTTRNGTNYLQCFGLAYALLGEFDTATALVRHAKRSLGPGRVFSSWRYRYVDRDSMALDLSEMERSIEKRFILPTFMSKEEASLH